MEQRLHKRYPIELMVRLVILGRVAAVAHADEICSVGMRIQNPNIDLKKGQKLTVNFVKPGHPRPINYSASATVVHSNSNTIGLMFDSDIPTQTIINETDSSLIAPTLKAVS